MVGGHETSDEALVTFYMLGDMSRQQRLMWIFEVSSRHWPGSQYVMYHYQDVVISENQRNAAGIPPHFELADSAVLGAGAETEAILCKSDVRVWNNCRSAGGAVGPASPRPLGERQGLDSCPPRGQPLGRALAAVLMFVG